MLRSITKSAIDFSKRGFVLKCLPVVESPLWLSGPLDAAAGGESFAAARPAGRQWGRVRGRIRSLCCGWQNRPSFSGDLKNGLMRRLLQQLHWRGWRRDDVHWQSWSDVLQHCWNGLDGLRVGCRDGCDCGAGDEDGFGFRFLGVRRCFRNPRRRQQPDEWRTAAIRCWWLGYPRWPPRPPLWPTLHLWGEMRPLCCWGCHCTPAKLLGDLLPLVGLSPPPIHYWNIRKLTWLLRHQPQDFFLLF